MTTNNKNQVEQCRHLERELEETKERLRMLYEASLEGIALHEGGKIIEVNASLARMFGYSAEELIGRDVLTFVADESKSLISERLANVSDTPFEAFGKRKDGGGFCCEVHAKTVLFHGRPVRVAVLRDISKRKEAEERTQAYLSMLKSTLESTADGILLVDRQGRIIRFNKRFALMWGIPQEILETKDDSRALEFVLEQLLNPNEFLAKVKALYNTPDAESFDVLYFKDGRVFERYSLPQYLNSKPTGRVWSFRDVSERVRQETEINERKQRAEIMADFSKRLSTSLNLKDICDVITEYMYPHWTNWYHLAVVSKDGSVLFSSARHVDAAKNQLVHMLEDCVINTINSGGSGERLAQGFVNPRTDKPERLRGVNGAVNAEFSIERVSSAALAKELEQISSIVELGKKHVQIIPLVTHGQVLGSLVFVSGDLQRKPSETDREFLYEMVNRTIIIVENALLLEEARKAAQLREDFISVASHELRTPLTALKFLVELLDRNVRRLGSSGGSGGSGGSKEKEQGLLRLIGQQRKEVRRFANLIEVLLDASRISRGRLSLEMHKTKLSEVVSEVVSRFHVELKSAGCTLKLDLDPSAEGEWDRFRLEQILTNLLSNAIKFGAGKPIEIMTKNLGNSILLTVRDYGIGVPRAFQHRIFERFERAVSEGAFAGMGLGLFITKELVEAHGGTIRVKSEPGAGSEFIVWFPVATRQIHGAAQSA